MSTSGGTSGGGGVLFPSLHYMDTVTRQEYVQLDDMIRVYIYGEGETPNVILRPQEIDLGKIPYNVPVNRELLIKNRLYCVPYTTCIMTQNKLICFPNKTLLCFKTEKIYLLLDLLKIITKENRWYVQLQTFYRFLVL